jgi:hypothetical protein
VPAYERILVGELRLYGRRCSLDIQLLAIPRLFIGATVTRLRSFDHRVYDPDELRPFQKWRSGASALAFRGVGDGDVPPEP